MSFPPVRTGLRIYYPPVGTVCIFRDRPDWKAGDGRDTRCQRLIFHADCDPALFQWEDCPEGSSGRMIPMTRLEDAITFARSGGRAS